MHTTVPIFLRCSSTLLLMQALVGCPDNSQTIIASCGGSACSTGFCYDGGCLEPNGDLDGDGLSNAVEAAFGAQLRNPDSDGDGIDDGKEFGAGSEPQDSDQDLVWDLLEHNGKDADCDGINDHLDATTSSEACDDGDPCTADSCIPDTGVCIQTLAPNQDAELCNGVDDDCDGEVDEGFPVGADCEITGSPCVNGVTRCDDNGATACMPGTAKDAGEICAEAVCAGTLLTPQRTCDGAGVCAIANTVDCDDDDPCTTDTCDPSAGLCGNVLTPISEVELCNGLDDDCDGEVDEDFQLGAACDPVDSPCFDGVIECDSGGAAVCSLGTPKTAGEPCADASCVGLVLSQQRTCDGAGVCAAATTLNCDDSDPCTTDTCDASGIGMCVQEGETPCEPMAPPTTSPLDGRLGVGTDDTITVQFAEAVAPASVTVQPSDGPCTGTAQVSTDDFSSCIGLTMVPVDGTAFSLIPVASLAQSTRHRVRVSAAVVPADGELGLENDYVHGIGFRTGVTPGPAKVAWVTTAYYPATGSFAAFDQRCIDDLSRPVGVVSAKAFVAGLGRYPCEYAFCSGGANSLDWVLAANTPYVRHDGESLATTDDDALWAFPLPFALSGFGTNFWSGLLADWTVDSANLCNDWTSGPGNGRVGWDENLDISTLNGGLAACTSTAKLFCIEQ